VVLDDGPLSRRQTGGRRIIGLEPDRGDCAIGLLQPRTSIPARDAKIYPYLLDGLVIKRPNQVWSSDLTYLPMAHGFLYLVAIPDVASRKVLSFRVSNTMTPDF
jgi:transposase InsO family protein